MQVRYLVVSEDRYKASPALHLANLLVRSEVSAQLGLHSLPASTAFFSSVDIDKVRQLCVSISCASKSSIRRFVITEKAPTRAFSWLKAATTAFTLKTLFRHYAKWALTPQSLNVKLGPQCKGHKGRAVQLA